MQKLNKIDLIAKRGCRCELCGISKWKGQPVANLLKVARRDLTNVNHTADNTLLVCVMCYYQGGYNRRVNQKRRYKGQMITPQITTQSDQAREPLNGPVVFAHDRATILSQEAGMRAREFELNKQKLQAR